MDGMLNILKPPGITSFGVVAYIRKLFKEKKVGHTGTLDPGVAGVLPLGLGKGTKVTQFLLNSDKAYRGEITFGISTDTQDAFGEVLATRDAAFVTWELLNETFARFTGELDQVPPMTSAVRYQGKKLYELALQGLTVERQPRKVKIHSLELLRFDSQGPYPKAIFDVSCSKGTYIRTLCHDIGQELGCGAYMSFLVRTKSGPFELAGALTLEEITDMVEAGRSHEVLLPIDSALPGLQCYELQEDDQKAVLHGNMIQINLESPWVGVVQGALVRLADPGGLILAIAEVKVVSGNSLLIQPIRVLR